MPTEIRPDKLHEKYCNGDSLTNIEVAVGATYFRELANMLVKAGPIFRLAFCEANRVADNFESFAAARARK